MRFFWNGVGNSLPRWLASLRVGLAAGRATFLWMSDRGFDPEDVDRRTGRRLTQINRPGMSLDQRPHHPRLHRMERLARRGEGRGRAVLRNPKVLSRSNISLGRPMLVKPRRQHDASVTPTISYHPSKSQGFDLGEFFTAMGGDWRWDKHSLARVRAALSSRNQSQTPYLARYYCRRHTWACMQPRFEYGPGGSPSVAEPYSAARSDGTQFGGPTVSATTRFQFHSGIVMQAVVLADSLGDVRVLLFPHSGSLPRPYFHRFTWADHSKTNATVYWSLSSRLARIHSLCSD